MSGSESENDYASADEDTEELSSSAHDKAQCQKTETSNEKPKEETLVEGEREKPKDSQSGEVSEIIEPEDKTKTVAQNSSTETEKPQKSPEESQKPDHVIDSQPRRVQLRLEKKIQQKSRATSLESQSEDGKNSQPVLTSSSSWGFGSWGTSFLSTAAASVSTFTNQVSQGIGTVLETVESSLGAQPAEELAAALRERKEQIEEPEDDGLKQQTSFEGETENIDKEDDQKEVEEISGIGSFASASGLLSSVTSLTKVIENTGSKMIMGGLDTLELIGKKTIDMITEGDPGLRKKRSAFNKVNLSQILREAKEKAETDQANMSLEDQEDSVYYSNFFDENQGLAHLEALEMLSNQCQQKVQGALMVSGDSDEKDMLEQISRICEDLPSAEDTPDDEVQDFEAAASVHITQLQIPFAIEKIKLIHSSVCSYLSQSEDVKSKDIKEIYRRAISSLAEFTARCVEQFHKFGELILVQQAGNDFDVLMCATHLTGLTSVLCIEISSFATRYCQFMNSVASETKDDTVSAFITNTYLEASNSTTYVQDAFQLLVPVLQSATLK